MVIAKLHLYSEVLQATQHQNSILCWQVFQAGGHSNSTHKEVGRLWAWEKKCGGELEE